MGMTKLLLSVINVIFSGHRLTLGELMSQFMVGVVLDELGLYKNVFS